MPSAPAFIRSISRDKTSNVPHVYFSHLLQKNIKTGKCNCRSDLLYSHSISSFSSHSTPDKLCFISLSVERTNSRHSAMRKKFCWPVHY